MFADCHAMLGWTIGLVGGGDVRLRRYSTLAAVLPDIDALPALVSGDMYATHHHTFGHNVFLWGLAVGLIWWRLRSLRAGAVVFLSFGSHLLADAYFSGLDLYLFWPCSRQGYQFAHSVGLGHPLNAQLFYAGLVLIAFLALIYKVTPISLASPALDRLLISVIERRRFKCSICGRGSNQRCSICGNPLCWGHSVVDRSFSIHCSHHESPPLSGSTLSHTTSPNARI
jgi:hypothetical protein